MHPNYKQNGEQILCRMCGKDMTPAIKVLGSPSIPTDSILAFHALAHARENFNKESQALVELIESCPSEYRDKLRQSFASVVGYMTQILTEKDNTVATVSLHYTGK